MNSIAGPAWAQGFDVAFLKEVAATFKTEFKPYTFGAFGIPNERDVASAHAEHQLIWTRARNSAIEAAAIARQLKRESVQQDFAHRSAFLQPGDVFVRSIAGLTTGKARILKHLNEASGGRAIWVEAHVESGTAPWLEAEGFERVMTKISAASDLKGLYLRRGTIEKTGRVVEAESPADVPGVKILRPEFISEAERKAILEEIEAFGRRAFAQHYSGYNKRKSWSAFALRGYDPKDPSFIIKPAEMSKKWKRENPKRLAAHCDWTQAAEAFPTIRMLLARLPGAGFQRVRLMRLLPKSGELTRHADITDPEAGTKDAMVARLHIPIVSDPKCLFRSWDEEGVEAKVHLPERALCYLDTRKPHAVVNPAAIERIHLVCDTFASASLREIIA